MGNHTPEIDIEAIRVEAKRKWMERGIEGRTALGFIERTVPFWLVIIAGVLFALSAPHTAAIFDKLTPGWGMFAPMGVEFGLLYAAFRRKRAKQAADGIPMAIWALEILLFVTAIIVNGAGSFMAVVASVAVKDLPLATMINQFGSFPGTTQVALVLVPIAAFIIPIGTSIAGEGLAALVFDRDRGREAREAQWETVAFDELRKAYFQAYVQAGMRPNEAKRQAVVLASGFVQGSQPLSLGSDSEVTGDYKPMTKREEAKRLLMENPDWHSLPLRELEARTGIDHNTWSIAKSKFNQNGHSKDE